MPERTRSGDERTSSSGRVYLEPGLGQAVLSRLAPLLADEGIDLDNVDPQSLQEALHRVAERVNLVAFTPVGRARSVAALALREAVDARASDGDERVRDVLARLQPESPDAAEATVAACIGISLGLLDDWLSEERAEAPPRARAHVYRGARTPSEHTARQIIVLARHGAALSSLGQLIVEHGGDDLLFGCVVALCDVARAWSLESDESVARVLFEHVR